MGIIRLGSDSRFLQHVCTMFVEHGWRKTVCDGITLLDKVLMVAVNTRDSLVELLCLDNGYIGNEGHNTEGCVAGKAVIQLENTPVHLFAPEAPPSDLSILYRA